MIAKSIIGQSAMSYMQTVEPPSAVFSEHAVKPDGQSNVLLLLISTLVASR